MLLTFLSPPPAAAAYRILCLGESTTAPTPPPDHSWPSQLEDILNKQHPGKFVVLNHLPEAGSAIAEKALPAYLDRYEPQMLVAMMDVGDPAESVASRSSRASRLVQAVRSRGLPVMLMSYPGVDGASLRAVIERSSGIVFIDNKKSFVRAVAAGRYEDYFQDRAFGSWGHATAKGNRLIAENAAREVLGIYRETGSSVKMSHGQLVAAYREVVQAHGVMDDEAGARGALARLLELLPDDLDALSLTAKINFDEDLAWEALFYADRAGADRLAGEIRLLLGDLAGAEANFERALLQNPRDAGLLLLLSRAKRDRPGDALAYARRSVHAGAGAAAHLFAGKLQVDLGDKAGAEESLARALELAPDDLDALHAMVRLKRGRKKEAFAYADRAERAAGQAPLWHRSDALRYSARIWIEIEEHARAAENLIRALAANPDDFDALLALVRIKDKLPQTTLARAHRGAGAGWAESEPAPEPAGKIEDELKRELEKDENHLEALRRLVELSRDQGRVPRAAVLAHRFQHAVSKAPLWQWESAYRLSGRLWLDLGREERAFQSLSRALGVNPDSIAARRAIMGLRRPQEEDSILGAADIDGFSHRFVRSAALRVELKDHAGAKECLRQALELNPANPSALQLQSRL